MTMRLPTVPTTSVVDHLNTTYFNQVWNTPRANARANFQIYKVDTRIRSGSVPVARSMVGLPTIDTAYAVYRVSQNLFGRFVVFPENTWIKDNDLFGVNNVSILVYDATGRLCPYGKTYFRFDPVRGDVLIAIDSVYTKKCTGNLYPELYVTVYKDPTRITPIVSSSYYVDQTVAGGVAPSTVLAAINTAATTYNAGTTVTINGWAYDPKNIPTIAVGDVVSITSDPDIVGYAEISVDDNTTGYYSTLYNEYRELLHIPKVLNPNNIVITHDTLTTVIFDSATMRGLFGHRLDRNALQSVTHNDFSMGRSALSAFSNALGASDVKVRLYIRLSSEPNYLTDDANHMRDLYSLSDTEIIKQLLGLSQNQLKEWLASNLEKSDFIPLLYNFAGFNATEVVPKFVSAMGYYDVASVLGQQMRYYTYRGAQVEVIKPARLFGYQCNVVAYCNGVKIPEQQVSVSNYRAQSFLIGFTPESSVSIGDRISLYIFESGDRTPVFFVPNINNPTINLESEDYTVYKMYSYQDPQKIWNGSATNGYSFIQKGITEYSISANQDGTYGYQFREKHYGSSFYLVPKYGMITATYPLSTTIKQTLPIIQDLNNTDNNGRLIPFFGYTTLEVYLNGRRLVEDIDYRCEPVIGPNNDILQTLLVVSNYDYFNTSADVNLLEVVIHGDQVISEDRGYVIQNKLYRTNPPLIYTKSSSRVFVRGVLQEDISQIGNVATTKNNVENGAPFLMQHCLAFGASKYLSALSPTDDLNLRSRIEHVLGILPPSLPDTVILDRLLSLYSPFLAQIVSDVGMGLFTIVDEPKNDQFLKQFAPYREIYLRDPTIGPANPLIDRRFVSLAAHYANYVVIDPDQMTRVQRLISLVLNPSDLSMKDVLI